MECLGIEQTEKATKAVRAFQHARLPASGCADSVAAFVKSSRGPLDLEFGCGAGVFSLRYAAENPGRRLIAVEKTREKFARFEGRLAHHERFANLLPLHANAISVLTHDLPRESLDRIFLWYPNPFPEKARFVRTPFFGRLIESLCFGGELWMATNVLEQKNDYEDLCVSRWGLRLIASESLRLDRDPDFRPRTLFEKKYFLRGEELYESRFAR